MNSKIHYCVRRSPPLVPLLNQFNPTLIFLSHFVKTHSNIILPAPSSFKFSLSWRFLDQIFVYILYISPAFYRPYGSHYFLFYLNDIWEGAQKIKILEMRVYPALCHFHLVQIGLLLSSALRLRDKERELLGLYCESPLEPAPWPIFVDAQTLSVWKITSK
jgi:hypothetical protein